jgi:hypothetical protein
MGTPEINNCEYNVDLGMRYQGRPWTFCQDLYVEGNLYVKGTIEESGGEGGSSSGGSAGPCFDELKAISSFVVEGDSYLQKGLQIDLDLNVQGIFASQYAKILKDLKVEGACCINKTVRFNDKLEVSGDTKFSGRLIVGDGDIRCEETELPEAKVVFDGTVLATGDTYCPNLISSEKVFAQETVTNTVRTDKLVIGGRVYREEEIEVTQGGTTRKVTVLVRHDREEPPEKPEDLRSCPVAVPCVAVPTPSPKKPTVNCP